MSARASTLPGPPAVCGREEASRKTRFQSVTDFPAKLLINPRLTLRLGGGNRRAGLGWRVVNRLSSLMSDRGTRRAEVGSCCRGSWLGFPRLFPISGNSQQTRLAALRALGAGTDGELVSFHDVQAYPEPLASPAFR